MNPTCLQNGGQKAPKTNSHGLIFGSLGGPKSILPMSPVAVGVIVEVLGAHLGALGGSWGLILGALGLIFGALGLSFGALV